MPDFTNLTNNLGLLITVLVAVPFLLVAVAFVVVALRSRMRADRSGSWNQTTAQVVKSQVESHQSYSSSSHTHTTMYDPVIVYEYVVAGQRYQNDRINFGGGLSTSWPGPSQEVVGRYQVGNTVNVYFDPANPAESVLERRAGGSSNIYLLVAGLIVVILLCVGVTTLGGMSLMGNVVHQFTAPFATQLPK